MNDVQTRTGVVRRAWRQALDGDRVWGHIDIRPDRFGVTRYRLVVYPPGIGESERRRVRLARGWPLWGTAMWVVAEIWGNQLTGPWTTLAISTTLVLGAGLVAVAMAGDTRHLVRSICASTMVGYRDRIAEAAAERLKTLAVRLLEADDALRDGRLTRAQHEMIWWQVYDRIADQPTASSGAA